MTTSQKDDYLIIFTWVYIARQSLEKYFELQNVREDAIVAMQYKIHRGFVVKTTETEFLYEWTASDFRVI